MQGRGTIGIAAAIVAAQLVAAPALAQTPTPSPSAAAVSGEVVGALEAGASLTFSIDVTMPGGWEALHEVGVIARSGGRELERITYDIEDVQLTVGEQRIVVGTGGVASGEHLRVSGADVVVTTGGGNLAFETNAEVLSALPDDVRFELSVHDDLGRSVAVVRGLQEPVVEGLTWETVVTAVLVALLAGGLIGNLFASKRRSSPRLSVYGVVDRRLRAERGSTSDG